MKASKENVSYMEITFSLDSKKFNSFVERLSWNGNFFKFREKLKNLDLAEYVEAESKYINALYQSICWYKREKYKKIDVRFLYSINRNQKPKYLFSQLIKAFEISSVNPHVVGISLVGKEYSENSQKDYKLHMTMIKFLRSLYPDVKVTLHAGELSALVVDSKDIKDHIDHAINIAKPERIGHGTAILYETKMNALLKKMRLEQIPVELCLSSNLLLLGERAIDGLLTIYLKNGVPITVNADNEGLFSTSLSKELLFATQKYNLSYEQLKRIIRNSIRYSFLPGDSFWEDPNYLKVAEPCMDSCFRISAPSKGCKEFLARNQKARLEWDLEKSLNDFENLVCELELSQGKSGITNYK